MSCMCDSKLRFLYHTGKEKCMHLFAQKLPWWHQYNTKTVKKCESRNVRKLNLKQRLYNIYQVSRSYSQGCGFEPHIYRIKVVHVSPEKGETCFSHYYVIMIDM